MQAICFLGLLYFSCSYIFQPVYRQYSSNYAISVLPYKVHPLSEPYISLCAGKYFLSSFSSLTLPTSPLSSSLNCKMPQLTSIFKRLRPGRNDCRPTWVPSLLELLPPELILCINDFLELPDTICLSRCSHHLHEVLRKPRLPAGDTLLKTTMLARIAPDMPHLFYCSPCAKLQFTADIVHPSVFYPGAYSSKKPRIPKRSKYCPQIDACRRKAQSDRIPLLPLNHCLLDFAYSFAHCHLMAAMKNHYHGHRYGPTAESLAYRKVKLLDIDPFVTAMLSVDSRVCVPGRGTDDAALVLQTQSWILIAADIDDDIIVDWLKSSKICHHTVVNNRPEDGDTTRVTEDWGFGHGKDHTSEHLSCAVCGVEYQFGLRDCGAHGKGYVITTWMDLGPGLDSNDPKWLDIITSCPHIHAPIVSSEVSKMFQEASRLQNRDSDPADLNQAILIGNRYRRSMRSLRRFLYKAVPPIRRYLL